MQKALALITLVNPVVSVCCGVINTQQSLYRQLRYRGLVPNKVRP